eukprot:GHVN01030680.1.p1 GENE.GHVN01030680.1~~GHVN01030680.1.p1  ORF type:complete len:210 (+),score=26.64 GHVN01030680.1:157-786(+)
MMLSAPRGYECFVIVTDASVRGIGAALAQEQEGEIVLLQFAAKRLTPGERRWDTRGKEALAVKWAVQRFEDYVKTAKMLVLSDHESLRWMWGSSSGKVQRWAPFLQQFDVRFHYLAGESNVVADWLSRCLEDEKKADEVIEAVAVPAFPAEQEQEKPPPIVLHPYVPTHANFVEASKEITSEEAKATYAAPDGMRYSHRTHRLFVPAAV